MSTIRIVRDVLDKKIVDRSNAAMGRVDGILISLEPGEQPRVQQIAIGGDVLAHRAGKWVVRPTRWMRKHVGPGRSGDIRIDWKYVTQLGRDVHVSLSAGNTEAVAWETWMAGIVARIPGSR
ncbi:MAG: hypothetical protein ABIZ36_11460 [Gemmatimonadaceae bacterium]